MADKLISKNQMALLHGHIHHSSLSASYIEKSVEDEPSKPSTASSEPAMPSKEPSRLEKSSQPSGLNGVSIPGRNSTASVGSGAAAVSADDVDGRGDADAPASDDDAAAAAGSSSAAAAAGSSAAGSSSESLLDGSFGSNSDSDSSSESLLDGSFGGLH